MPDVQIALVTAGPEGEAAAHWIRELPGASARVFRSLDQVPLAGVERIWVHAISADPSLDLVAWLRAGGRLLATGEGAELAWRLGLEPVPPDDRRVAVWKHARDEFRPDTEAADPAFRHARGLAAFGPHPLFAGFGNGACTWTPVEDETYRWVTYRAERPERGAGVAVEWAGHVIHAARWVAWEYDVGEGGILCLGAFANLETAVLRCRATVERLLANALLGDAIPHSTRSAPVTHWPGSLGADEESAVVTLPATLPDHLQELWDEWSPTTSPILLESGAREDAPWSATGRRALVHGGERSGLGEIWVHPYRLARDFHLEINGRPAEVSIVRVAPDEVVRVLRAGEVELTERVSVALDYGLIFWSVVADSPASIVLRWETDLRRSAPYPARTSRVKVDALGDSGMRLSLDRQPAAAEVLLPAGTLVAHGTRLEARGEGILRVIFVGGASEAELTRALDALKRRKLRAFRQERLLHSRRIEERLTVLETPESHLDQSFHWAKVRIDAALAETPGLGRCILDDEFSRMHERVRYLGPAACDAALAALATGDREIARDVVRLIGRSVDGAGVPARELSTSGLAWCDDASMTARRRQLVLGLAAWTGDTGPLERLRQLEDQDTEPGAPRLEWARRAEWEAGRWDALLADLRAHSVRPGSMEPRGSAWAASLLRGVIEGLWGIVPDATAEAVAVAPFLPPAWKEMALRRLRVGATTLDLRVRRRPGQLVLGVERVHGPRIRLTALPRGTAAPESVLVDDEPLGGGRAAFSVSGEHEVVFVFEGR